MGGTLLFCTAEEAKTAINSIQSKGRRIYLVESRECPSDESGFKTEVANEGDVESAFISASEKDCQKWYSDHEATALFIEPNHIVIADARTAKDGTVLLQWYRESGEECSPYGVLPPESDTWWDYRILPEHIQNVVACLEFVASDVSFPVYIGRKDEFTDENGVFDAEKADQAMAKGS
ncbi:unnamed protein product [Periconia digitata]|uniref:Uncharacterized protein n=1 Tax=Periconia digitata TaxID=1303443 RepID=A0A9W4UGF5_9PLEO|nr:unnamed protein product [Periconia digitata]